MPDNQIIGQPIQNRASIRFEGEGNLLVCQPGVDLGNSALRFAGSGSVAYLCASRHPYRLDMTIYHDSALFVGADCYMNGAVHLVISEQCHVLIGRQGLISTGVWLRTADPHLLYDAATRRRVNQSRSIFVGDHVWLGQDVFLLKGTQIGSGAVAAARAVVPGKTLYSNCVYGGNPVRLLRENVFYDGECAHAFQAGQTRSREQYPDDRYIYAAQPGADPFTPLDQALRQAGDAQARLAVLEPLGAAADRDKNRFAIAPPRRGLFGSKERGR